MRLAEAGAAVEEEPVVCLRGRFGDGQRGCVREAVRRADHERVEGVLRVEAAALGPYAQALDHGNDGLRPHTVLRQLLAITRDPELERVLEADDVADGGSDQAEEVTFDPVAGELARHGEHERLVLERELADVAEPLPVRPVAEGLPEPSRDLLPEVLCRQLELVFHRRPDPPRLRPGGQHNSDPADHKTSECAGLFWPPGSLHRCGRRWGKPARPASLRPLLLWISRWTNLVYTDRRAPPTAGIFLAKTSLFTS